MAGISFCCDLPMVAKAQHSKVTKICFAKDFKRSRSLKTRYVNRNQTGYIKIYAYNYSLPKAKFTLVLLDEPPA